MSIVGGKTVVIITMMIAMTVISAKTRKYMTLIIMILIIIIMILIIIIMILIIIIMILIVMTTKQEQI